MGTFLFLKKNYGLFLPLRMSFSKNSSSVVSSAFSAPASINRKARTKQPNSQTRQKKKKRKRKRNLDSGRCRLFDVLLFYYFIVTPLNGVYFLSGPTTRGYPSSFRPHPKNRYCSLSIKGRMVARLPSLDRSGKTISRFLPFFFAKTRNCLILFVQSVVPGFSLLGFCFIFYFFAQLAQVRLVREKKRVLSVSQ